MSEGAAMYDTKVSWHEEGGVIEHDTEVSCYEKVTSASADGNPIINKRFAQLWLLPLGTQRAPCVGWRTKFYFFSKPKGGKPRDVLGDGGR